MATHGVPRTQPPPTPAALKTEAAKIQTYRTQSSDLANLIREETFTPDTLQLTTNLLQQNPEHYTTWNHRRLVLLSLLSPADNPIQLLTQDLEWIIPLLIKFPKCYWIWNHRIWCLDQVERLNAATAETAWKGELKLVSKMLARDSRNFHGWDYRRIVVSHLRKFGKSEDEKSKDEGAESTSASVPTETDVADPLALQEFAYTTTLLHTNLSNFSAWHARSKLLPRIHRTPTSASKEAFYKELSFLRDGLLLDPYDQSLWKYHEYLMFVLTASPDRKKQEGTVEARDATWVDFAPDEVESVLSGEIEQLSTLEEDCDDCKWLFLGLLGIMEVMKNKDKERMKGWLAKLRELDPIREGRWKDLEMKLKLGE